MSVKWRLETAEGFIQEYLNMTDEEAQAKAREMLTKAGMNKEEMESSLLWDEFVYNVVRRPDYLERWLAFGGDFGSLGNAANFVMGITTY